LGLANFAWDGLELTTLLPLSPNSWIKDKNYHTWPPLSASLLGVNLEGQNPLLNGF
jgi:hypothetical protein